MDAIPRYTPQHWLDDLQHLAKQAYESHSLPFINTVYYPANINIVRNNQGGDINSQKLELKAACLGLDRLTWIFGADAEFMGLRLKTSEKMNNAGLFPDTYAADPVLLLALVSGRKSDCLDAQYAYFIDQFTGNSINHCCGYINKGFETDNGNAAITKQRSIIARNILFSLQKYDNGLIDKDIQLQNYNNIKENSSEGSPGFIHARASYKAYTRNYTQYEKNGFNSIREYLGRQNTAKGTVPGNKANHGERVYLTFKPLIENITSLSKVWFYSSLFNRVLMSNQFNYGPIENKEHFHNRKEANHDR
jgi:hypothetical protein